MSKKEKNIWDEFNEAIDVEGLKKDIEEVNENSPSYKDVPFGEYEVSVEKLELVKSKSGNPMVSVWFKILDGEFKNSRIFWNQVVNQAFQFHIIHEFIDSLESEVEFEFVDYNQFGNMLMDVHEDINNRLEYAISYDENNKGFTEIEVLEVFEI